MLLRVHHKWERQKLQWR